MGEFAFEALCMSKRTAAAWQLVFGVFFAQLFGRIQIHYSAHYSDRIEYLMVIEYSVQPLNPTKKILLKATSLGSLLGCVELSIGQ